MALTVGELKELLEDVPDNYEVQSEGCDCIGDAHSIEVNHLLEDVLISRQVVEYKKKEFDARRPEPFEGY